MPLEHEIFFREHTPQDSGAPEMLLVHGAGSSSLGWPPGIRQLPGHRVISIDLPGHGYSPGPACASVTSLAQHLLQFIKALGLTRPHLVGHSLGGAVCLTAAGMAPGRVRSVVGISCAGRCTLPKQVRECLSDMSRQGEVVDWLLDRLASPGLKPERLESLRRALLGMAVETLYSDLQTCTHYRLDPGTHRITAPVLLVAGRFDRFVPPQESQALAQKIPGAQFHLQEGGHLLLQEQPHELAHHIAAFVSSLRNNRA